MAHSVLGRYLDRHLEPIRLGFDKHTAEFLKKYPPTIDSSVGVGIEIECENGLTTSGVNDSNNTLWNLFRQAWISKEDGSLRNHGVEFVTPQGMTAQQASQALPLLSDVLDVFYSRITANARTGVHIHLDFLSKTPEQIGTFILLYSLLEQSLFKYSGGRHQNIFCVPIRESFNQVGAILRHIRDQSKWDTLFRSIVQSQKYAAFNLLALSSYGTIEFRHGHGTNRPHTVIPWLKTLVSMYHYAEKQKFEDFLERVRKLNTTSEYEEIARAALPEEFFRRVNIPVVIQDMTKGCAFVKECLIAPEEVSVNPTPLRPETAEEIRPLGAQPLRGQIRRAAAAQIVDPPDAWTLGANAQWARAVAPLQVQITPEQMEEMRQNWEAMVGRTTDPGPQRANPFIRNRNRNPN